MFTEDHPFYRFHFCPLCGSNRFVEHGPQARHCEDCGFTYYTNPFLDLDETAEEGMCREIKEETGLEVKPEDLHYLFSQPNRYPYSGIMCRTIDLFFEVRVKGRLRVGGLDDISSLEWIPLKNLNLEEFGLASIRKGLARYLEERG